MDNYTPNNIDRIVERNRELREIANSLSLNDKATLLSLFADDITVFVGVVKRGSTGMQVSGELDMENPVSINGTMIQLNMEYTADDRRDDLAKYFDGARESRRFVYEQEPFKIWFCHDEGYETTWTEVLGVLEPWIPLDPYSFTPECNIVMVLKCEEHVEHEWQERICDYVADGKPSPCPYCSGRALPTINPSWPTMAEYNAQFTGV